MITIDIDDRALREALQRLRSRLDNLRPVLADIGEHLAETTKQRFAQQRAPDGTPWAPNSPVTVERYLRAKAGNFGSDGRWRGFKKGYVRKDGTLAARAVRLMGAKRPLHGQSGRLAREIWYRAGADVVEVGSSLVYAAVQQFGARRRQFGRSPWGDIPARPFLGVSDADHAAVAEIVAKALADAVGG